MPQKTDRNITNLTVRIPENQKIQIPLPDVSDEKKSDTRQFKKKGHTTTVNSLLDRIFSQEEQQTVKALSIHADPSVDFRSRLEISGKKYKIEKVVATGGFGRIFQAEDKVLGRTAIVKTLKEEFMKDDKAIENFIAEAKLSSQLDHPGIVPLFSLDTDTNNGLHLAMQKITGITLEVYLQRCRDMQLENHFSQKLYDKMLSERLEVFLHICDTIAYCHNRGVLHNDLKPNNIMIGRYGQVYVMDWGIASVNGVQKSNQNAGSPAYMAPERICSGLLSVQTDIFALGMILNEMVTLRPPIEDEISAVFERICTGRFEPSTCVDPKCSISATLQAIIEKARNPNPQERYESVEAFSEDIRRFLFHEETLAYPDSGLRVLSRFLFHHRKFTMTLAGVLVFLIIAAVGYNFYNAALITQRANQRTLWKLNLVSSTDNQSAAIGKRLLLLQEKTANMGSALAIEYGKKLYDTNARTYWNNDFAPRAKNRPPGLIHTAAYRGKAITFSTGTFYRFNDQISGQEIQDWANNFRAQQSQHFANILADVHNKDARYTTDKLKLYYEHGGTVQRIICVLDNGLVYCYPGKYEPVESQNAFIPKGVQRELRSGKEFVWSSPYLASGQIVISCWHTIKTLRGNKIGVIGMVVLYQDILRDFLNQIDPDNEKEIYTLIDSDARIIYSTAHEFSTPHVNADSSTESMIGRHPYKWYSEVVRRIRENPAQAQFTALIDRKNFNITWKQIPSADWLLIQHVPLKTKQSIFKLRKNK